MHSPAFVATLGVTFDSPFILQGTLVAFPWMHAEQSGGFKVAKYFGRSPLEAACFILDCDR